jgi:hypothetical protein
MLGTRYLEHLSPGDLRLLAEFADTDAAELASRPRAIEGLVADPRLHRRLFERGPEPFLVASTFLVFAVLIERCAAELRESPFILDRTAVGGRLPVFDAHELSDFLEDGSHRLFLAELLASFTRTASGVVYRRDGRGVRTHRFSELDPIRLAGLLEVVEESMHPGIYRRLGDCALFLTGVFPDHSTSWLSKPLNSERLHRAAHSVRRANRSPTPRSGGGLALLQHLGEASYELAYVTAPSPRTHSLQVVARVARRFDQARRVLDYLADRYLSPVRLRWFGGLGDGGARA